jgi:Tol biopolymer transport system component
MSRSRPDRWTQRILSNVLWSTMGGGAMSRALVVLVTAVAASLGVGIAQAGRPVGVNGKIAFTRDDPTTEFQRTYVIDPDGTHETQISADAGCPGWSPGGSKLLVCAFNAAGFLRPAVSDPDGSGFTLLDPYPHRALQLRCGLWSPSGDRFLCTSDDEDRPSTNGIYTLRSTDGGDLVRVTSAPEGLADLPVGYSPDGSRILFLRNDSNGNWGDLFVVKPDGSGMVRLNPPDLKAAGSNFDGDFGFDSCCGPAADWSPDGARIAFGARWRDVTGKPTPFAVYVVQPDGSGLRRITPLGIGAGRNHVRWSPDGQEIAFATRRGAVHLPEVWVVRPDGGGLTELTKPLHLDLSVGPVWSPDSTQLVFQSYHPEINGGQADLWIIDADGSGLHRLTGPVDGLIGEANPAWGSAPTG